MFIVHGEDLVTMSFADCLKDEHGLDAFAPYSGTVFNLTTETFEKITEPVAVKKEDRCSIRRAEQRIQPSCGCRTAPDGVDWALQRNGK